MMQPEDLQAIGSHFESPFTLPSFLFTHHLDLLNGRSFLCDSILLLSPNLHSLCLDFSTHELEEWDILTHLCLANLSELWLKIKIPTYVVRAMIKHHPLLMMLDMTHTTIVDNDLDSSYRYSLKGFKCSIQHFIVHPTLVPTLKVLTFIDLCYVELVPGPETWSSPGVFVQSMLSASFSPQTLVHLALPSPQKFNYQVLHEINQPQAIVVKLCLKFNEAFNTTSHVLVSINSEFLPLIVMVIVGLLECLVVLLAFHRGAPFDSTSVQARESYLGSTSFHCEYLYLSPLLVGYREGQSSWQKVTLWYC